MPRSNLMAQRSRFGVSSTRFWPYLWFIKHFQTPWCRNEITNSFSKISAICSALTCWSTGHGLSFSWWPTNLGTWSVSWSSSSCSQQILSCCWNQWEPNSTWLSSSVSESASHSTAVGSPPRQFWTLPSSSRQLAWVMQMATTKNYGLKSFCGSPSLSTPYSSGLRGIHSTLSSASGWSSRSGEISPWKLRQERTSQVWWILQDKSCTPTWSA